MICINPIKIWGTKNNLQYIQIFFIPKQQLKLKDFVKFIYHGKSLFYQFDYNIEIKRVAFSKNTKWKTQHSYHKMKIK